MFFFLVLGCSNSKVVYWCGDHPCINNKEKEAYFKKTMIVETKNIKKGSYKGDTEIEKFSSNNNLKEFCISLKKYNRILRELTSWIQKNFKSNQNAVNALATEYLNIFSLISAGIFDLYKI